MRALASVVCACVHVCVDVRVHRGRKDPGTSKKPSETGPQPFF